VQKDDRVATADDFRRQRGSAGRNPILGAHGSSEVLVKTGFEMIDEITRDLRIPFVELAGCEPPSPVIMKVERFGQRDFMMVLLAHWR
jgi:hypothetical protein